MGMLFALRDVTYRRGGRIVLRSNKFHIFKFQSEIVDSFLNQVSIFLFDVAELGSRHAHINYASTGMTEASWLQPGIVRMAIDFLFESVEDANPRIRR